MTVDTAFEDLTARARIREAALTHFAEEGYERSTIRGIARTAGVSLGLVRHHFGSKDGLRQACDHHVFETLRQLNAQLLEDPVGAAELRRGSERFQRYVARALVDGSATVASLFDEMVTMTEEWIARADEGRSRPPPVDRRVRAALVTAMAAGIPLLHEHVSRAMGTSIFEPEGDRLMALALLDLYSHSLISEDTAASAGAAFEKAPRGPSVGGRQRAREP
jgi:AcrR family transcriptional regulator